VDFIYTKSKFIIQKSDIKSDLFKIIRPKLDRNYIELLHDKEAFASDAYELILENIRLKMMKSAKSSKKEISDSDQREESNDSMMLVDSECDGKDSDQAEIDEALNATESLYIPIDTAKTSVDSSDDPFDLWELRF